MSIKTIVAAATTMMIASTFSLALAQEAAAPAAAAPAKSKPDCAEVIKRFNHGEKYRQIASEMGLTLSQVKHCRRKAHHSDPNSPAGDPAMNHRGTW